MEQVITAFKIISYSLQTMTQVNGVDLWTAAANGWSAVDSTFSVDRGRSDRNVMHTCLIVRASPMVCKQREEFEVDCPWLTSTSECGSLTISVEFMCATDYPRIVVTLKVPNRAKVNSIVISDSSAIICSETLPWDAPHRIYHRLSWRVDSVPKSLYIHALMSIDQSLFPKHIQHSEEASVIASNLLGCQTAMNKFMNRMDTVDTFIPYTGGQSRTMHSSMLLCRSESLRWILEDQKRAAISTKYPYTLDLTLHSANTVVQMVHYLYGHPLTGSEQDAKTLLLIFIALQMTTAVASVQWFLMNLYHSKQISTINLKFDTTWTGVDRSLMHSLKIIKHTLPYTMIISCKGEEQLLTHGELFNSFIAERVGTGKHIDGCGMHLVLLPDIDTRDIQDLLDIIYCSAISYRSLFREEVLPRLYANGLVSFIM